MMRGREKLKEESRRLPGQTDPTCWLLPFNPGVGWGVRHLKLRAQKLLFWSCIIMTPHRLGFPPTYLMGHTFSSLLPWFPLCPAGVSRRSDLGLRLLSSLATLTPKGTHSISCFKNHLCGAPGWLSC